MLFAEIIQGRQLFIHHILTSPYPPTSFMFSLKKKKEELFLEATCFSPDRFIYPSYSLLLSLNLHLPAPLSINFYPDFRG